MILFRYLAIPLALTLLIETIVLFLLKEKRKKVFILSIGMNIVTNISLNLIGYYTGIEEVWLYILMVVILEFLIWVLEGIGYFLLIKDKNKAIFYSLACNGMSFLLGIVFQLLLNYIWR